MKKNFIIRNLVMISIVLVMIILIYLILVSTLPELISIVKTGDIKQIQYYLKHQSTIEGMFYVGLIQLLQIWTIFISGIPLQFAAGIVFDAIPTFFVCSFSAILSMTISFLVWKNLGHSIEKIIPLTEKEEKMIQNALNRNTSYEFLLFLISFIFVMPNGLIPIMASKTDISMKKFIKAITPGVSFNVLICSLEGDRLIAGDWSTLISVIVLGSMIIFAFWKLHERINAKGEKM